MSQASRRPTAHDVARLAGLSQSAVSRAFTEGASISEATRARVMEAARELGYRPNLIARSLITQRSRTVAIAMGNLENQFFPAILEAISTDLSRAGYRVLLFTAGAAQDADPILEEVLRYQVEAVILASARMSSHFAEECRQVGVPVVLFNRVTADAAVSSITGENEIGGRSVARFLLAGGHQRIAYIAGVEDSSTNREREAGFVAGLAEAGATLAGHAIGNYDFETAQQAARELLGRRERPDAIFCANDHTAFAVMQTARAEFGLAIGTELSIVGFDDVPLASWPAFSLTTYGQPFGAMARKVVEVTLDHITDADAQPVHVVVPGRLVVRSSARTPVES